MGNQVFIPMLSYEDGVAAMDWLVKVFGFTERERWLDDSGVLTHGELALEDQVVMVASPSPLYQSPKSLQASHAPAAELAKVPFIINGVMVYVADVDATLALAKVAGAGILSEIVDGFPGRRFRMEDLEGQRWYVFQR